MLKSRIAELRDAKKWTQEELGEKVGLSAKAIGAYEQGIRKPRAETLWLLAQALGVEVPDLFEHSDGPATSGE